MSPALLHQTFGLIFVYKILIKIDLTCTIDKHVDQSYTVQLHVLTHMQKLFQIY